MAKNFESKRAEHKVLDDMVSQRKELSKRLFPKLEVADQRRSARAGLYTRTIGLKKVPTRAETLAKI